MAPSLEIKGPTSYSIGPGPVMNPRAFISTSTITSIAKTAYSTAVTPTTATLFHSFKASFKLPYRRKGRDSPI